MERIGARERGREKKPKTKVVRQILTQSAVDLFSAFQP